MRESPCPCSRGRPEHAAGSLRPPPPLPTPVFQPTCPLPPNAAAIAAAKFINILAEDADVVAAWLVPRLRGATGNGGYLRYLTPPEVVRRLATAPWRRNRFIPESGTAAGYTRI